MYRLGGGYRPGVRCIGWRSTRDAIAPHPDVNLRHRDVRDIGIAYRPRTTPARLVHHRRTCQFRARTPTPCPPLGMTFLYLAESHQPMVTIDHVPCFHSTRPSGGQTRRSLSPSLPRPEPLHGCQSPAKPRGFSRLENDLGGLDLVQGQSLRVAWLRRMIGFFSQSAQCLSEG